MPKEEEKEYLKILGVDKYSPESRFFRSYVTLFTMYILQAIHYPGTSELKWAMEYTLVE